MTIDIARRLRINAQSADAVGDTMWAADMTEAADTIGELRQLVVELRAEIQHLQTGLRERW
jgi:hypothetical protein